MKTKIGNLLGIMITVMLLWGALPAHSVVASDERAPVVHVVQWGDALWKIAARYGVTQEAIIQANGLTSPDRIYAGQRLVIPAASGGPVSSAPGAVHVVQRGETLAQISQNYGVPMSSVIAANNLINPSHIEVGQRLAIPGAVTTPIQQPDEAVQSVSTRHVVQRGETLMLIAGKYNVSMWTLAQHNHIANPSVLFAGQVLAIPGSDSVQNETQQPQEDLKLVVVDLSDQRAYAYQNGELIREFVVSTGLPSTPTVTGNFTIYKRYTSQRMVGPGYNLPGVPWVMYFYQGYGFHGTYWHDKFGQPMSHGCVNMKTDEAEWLYNWAPDGTAVHVQQ